MNYLEIIKLVERLETIEETLVYWNTPTFTSSIESTLHNIKRLEQEREDIKFQLEFPYLLFELLTQVEDIEGARVQVYKRQKDNITAISVDYKGVYHYIRIDENNKECLDELATFIHKCKEPEAKSLTHQIKVLCKDERGNQFTLNGLVQEDGSIICEPMTESRTIVDWENRLTGDNLGK